MADGEEFIATDEVSGENTQVVDIPSLDDTPATAPEDTAPAETDQPLNRIVEGGSAYDANTVRRAVMTGGEGGNNAINVPGDKKSQQRAAAENRASNREISALATEATYNAAYKTVVAKQRETVKKEEQKLTKMQMDYDRMSSLMSQLEFKLHEWDIAQAELKIMATQHSALVQQIHQQSFTEASKYVSDLQKARAEFHAELLEKQAQIERLISKTDDRFYKLETAKILSSTGYEAEAQIYQRENKNLDAEYVFKDGDTYYTFVISGTSEGAGKPMQYEVHPKPVDNPTLIAEIEYAVEQGAKLITKEEASAIADSVKALQNGFSQTQFDNFMKRQEDLHMDEKLAELEKGIAAQRERIEKLESEITEIAKKLGMDVDANNPNIASIKEQFLAKQQEQNKLLEAIKEQEVIVAHHKAFLAYMEKDDFERMFKEKVGSLDTVITVSIEKDIMTIPGIYDPKFIAGTVLFMQSEGFNVVDIPENVKKVMPEVAAQMKAQAEAAKNAEAFKPAEKQQKQALNSSVADKLEGRAFDKKVPNATRDFATSAAPGTDVVTPSPTTPHRDYTTSYVS